MRIAITGGTGFIGRHLVEHLLERGEKVRVLTRRADLVRRLWATPNVEPWVGDLTVPETLGDFAMNARVVYHLAGEIRDATRFHQVNVTGTKNLLKVCRHQELERFVYLSSTGVMGASGTGIINESMPCHPQSDYEKSKYAGEMEAVAASKKLQTPVTILRPPNVFGEGRRQNGDLWLAWLRAIQKGRFRFFGRGNPVANYVYVGDVVRGCLLVTERKEAVGGVYIVSDPCSLRDFVSSAAQFLGVETPGTLPIWLGYALAVVLEGVGRMAGFSPPLTVNRVRALTNRLSYSSEKLRKELGFTPAFGWREGLRRTVKWYRHNSHLPFSRS
jgi:dihydroflavonol-4-reductase